MKHKAIFPGLSRRRHGEYSSARPAKTAMIFESELDFISRCILDYKNIETGGQLFGYWTAGGVPVVLFAIGPGTNANHQVAFFNQDVDYLTKLGSALIEKFGIQHIGEWHSHHQLGLAHPSGHDASTMVNCIRRQELGRFLLCIGNCTDTQSTFNAFNFTQDAGYDYLHAAWDVKDGVSPFRNAIEKDTELASMIINPVTLNPCHGDLKLLRSEERFQKPSYAEDYWLKDKRNNLVLKRIVEMLGAESDTGKCAVQMGREGVVHLVFDWKFQKVRIVFPQGFPAQPPLVTLDGGELPARGGNWCFTGDIYAAFESYWEQIVPERGAEHDEKQI